MFVQNLPAMVCVWFAFGMMESVSAQVGYVYLIEMMPKRAQTPVTTAWNI